jgi:predicted Zn-dependent protease
MGGGLVLFGVGTGVGGGGLLNAFSGGSNNQTTVVSQQEKTALRETQLNPGSAQAWSDLMQARWDNAKQGSDYNASSGTFTTAGKNELAQAAQDWQHYLQLTKNPDSSLAEIAGRVYAAQGDYANSASAWDIETTGNPNATIGFECLAATAYAAKETRKGDLAAQKALTLVPKLQQLTIKQDLAQAKNQPQVAQQIVAQDC